MSRIDKALEKAGMVPASDPKAADAAEQKELISEWGLDGAHEGEPVDPQLVEAEKGERRTETSGRLESQPSASARSDTDVLPGADGQMPADAMSLSGVDAPVTTDDDFPGLSTALNESFEDKLVAMPGMEFQSVEQFRRLAAMLHLMQGNHKLKTVLVTSALPAEGKTLTASNLALCLSGSYRRRVLLIDCDLRRPTVNELFDVPAGTGLTEWLRHSGPEGPSIQRVSKNLSILPAGRPDPDPMGVLTSDRMQELVAEASKTVDWIVLDSPPVGLLSDGHLLSAMADAVVLVVRAAHTPYADVQKAVEALGRDRIAGVVLNQVEPRGVTNRYYGYGSYGYEAKPAGSAV